MDEEITPSTPLPSINSININGQDYQLEDTVARKRAEAGTSQDMLLEMFYPIGRLWISKDPTSPAEKIGGVWEQITGAFLRAANDTATGGSDTLSLTGPQMPTHDHGFPIYQSINEVNSNNLGLTSSSPSFGGRCIVRSAGSNIGMISTSAGSREAFDNRPSFQNVYAWHRVA